MGMSSLSDMSLGNACFLPNDLFGKEEDKETKHRCSGKPEK
jgi:hypothetical protein